MRIRFTSLVVLLSAVCMLSSCLKDDDDETNYTYNRETAITAFSLGTMNRYLHTTTAAGNDSVYKLTYTGSNYKFTIDQIGRRIYNTDSLPYGTDAKHVIATISAANNGGIFIKATDSDSLAYYSNTDSIDFSTPRTVRIYAQDGQRYADYNVTLNVRTVPEGTIAWEQKGFSQELSQLDNVHAVSAGNRIFVFGTSGTNTIGYSTGINDGAAWTQLSATLSSKASIVAKDGVLYALDNGTVLSSADGQTWTTVAINNNLKRLVAASTAHLYALTTNDGTTTTGIASSADNGQTWTNEALDDDASLLPDDGVEYTCTPLHTNDSIDQVMIVGRVSAVNDIIARTWTKLDDYSQQPIEATWTHVVNSGINDSALGEIPSLAVTVYGGYPVALISNGTTTSSLLRSRDGGLTWEAAGRTLPAGLSPLVGKLTMTTDSEGSLWIISNGTVWKD